MSLSSFVYLLTGALLTLIGGAFGNLIKGWSDRNSERNYISISLTDELEDITETIKKLEETWSQTQQVSKQYMVDLSQTMQVYQNSKDRLFVYKDSQIRKDISIFYKKLRKEIDNSQDKAGTLAKTQAARAEQEGIKNRFCSLAVEAKALIDKLK